MRATSEGLFRRLPSDARLLFVRLRSMGDCLLLTSPLAALKQQFPGFRVSILVEPQFADCFHHNPDVEAILTTRSTKWGTIVALRRNRFDAIVNLHGGPTSLVYALLGRGESFGFAEGSYPWLYSGVIPRCDRDLHSVDLNMERLRWLGLDSAPAPPLSFARSESEAEWARARTGAGPYVVVHPGARFATKQWFAGRFRTIAEMFAGEGWRVVVTAGPGEEPLAREVASGLDRARVLIGLTIPHLAEVIRNADLYLGNDSGPMHLAAAVGTPTVAVWGSSSATRWYPWRVPHRVVRNPFECNPCAGYRCHVAATPSCIESVTEEQVRNAVQALLAECGKPESTAAGTRNDSR